MPWKESFTGRQFRFELDGSKSPGFIRSVTGGNLKGNITEARVGVDFKTVKHVSTIEASPITLELGMEISPMMLDWINESLTYKPSYKDGSITHGDFGFKGVYMQEFSQALITEIKFPNLEGGSKEPAYLEVTLEPESVSHTTDDAGDLRGSLDQPKRQKEWLECNFRVEIDGLDCVNISKVESISVTQKVEEAGSGQLREAERFPTVLEFGNISLHMALAHAKDFLDWHQRVLHEGKYEEEKTGSITFLARNLKDELLTVELFDVGIFNIELTKSQAGQDEIKRVKAELYFEGMKLKK